MISLFLGLTCANMLALTIAMVLGYLVQRDPGLWGTYHQLAGVLAAMTCVAVHCIVFTYFVATAKWVQHAVGVKHLDPALMTPTRSFKAQAFPAALLAMAVVFVTAVAGAAAFSGYFASTLVHHVLAWVSMGVNLVVAWIEYRAIARNAALIDTILAQITPDAAASSEPAVPLSHSDGRGSG